MRGGWVYIVTNRPDGTLYVGVTNDLPRRIAQHKAKQVPGFTARYGLTRLVYAEPHDDIRAAIQREKKYQALAACLEGAFDPRCQSGLGRSLRGFVLKPWMRGSSPRMTGVRVLSPRP